MVDLSDHNRLAQYVELLVEARARSESGFLRVAAIHLLGWAVFAALVWLVASAVIDPAVAARPIGDAGWLYLVPLGAAMFSFVMALTAERDTRRREARIFEQQIALLKLGGDAEIRFADDAAGETMS